MLPWVMKNRKDNETQKQYTQIDKVKKVNKKYEKKNPKDRNKSVIYLT